MASAPGTMLQVRTFDCVSFNPHVVRLDRILAKKFKKPAR
jgi:hypothetical protein